MNESLETARPPVSKLAIASLACALAAPVSPFLVGAIGFIAIPTGLLLTGLLCGIAARRTIKKAHGKVSGQVLANVATAMSGLFLVGFVVLGIPALLHAQGLAETIKATSNAKRLSLGISLFASDHNDNLPTANRWCELIRTYVEKQEYFQSPARPKLRSGFAFNAALSGLREDSVKPDAVLIFESDSGWNAAGGPEIMIAKPRRGRTFIVALADGSVHQMTAEAIQSLQWKP